MEASKPDIGAISFDEMRTPEWQAAKNKVHKLYVGPGFSGIGGCIVDGRIGILVLFFDSIPSDIVTVMDGIPVEAKIVGQITKQAVNRDWGDDIADARGGM